MLLCGIRGPAGKSVSAKDPALAKDGPAQTHLFSSSEQVEFCVLSEKKKEKSNVDCTV